MGYRNFVKMPTLAALRDALEYEPSNKQQPLLCKTQFEDVGPGKRPGFKANNNWLVTMGTGNTYLRNLVWRVVEGSVPSGFAVDYVNSDDSRIENLFLRSKTGEIRRPKSAPPESLVPVPGMVRMSAVAESARQAQRTQTKRARKAPAITASHERSSSDTTPPWAD